MGDEFGPAPGEIVAGEAVDFAHFRAAFHGFQRLPDVVVEGKDFAAVLGLDVAVVGLVDAEVGGDKVALRDVAIEAQGMYSEIPERRKDKL